MTNEEKVCFYALYINQKVGRSIFGNRIIHDRVNRAFIELFGERYLELRTIDQLGYDELLVLGIKSVKGVNPMSSGWIDELSSKSYLDNLIQPQIDYLRSIGVLVGFRNFTTEMLIAEGVVKIKS